MADMWATGEAMGLCRQIEAISPNFGCHVALTGGLLYKDGPRKDCDVLFYRIRQVDAIDIDGLFTALEAIGIVRERGFGWCIKVNWNGKPMDCFFPEEQGGEYVRDDSDEAQELRDDVRAWKMENAS